MTAQPQTVYHRKLYALLRSLSPSPDLHSLTCLQAQLDSLGSWWETCHEEIAGIAQASDRLMFQSRQADIHAEKQVRHLISGQSQSVSHDLPSVDIPDEIKAESNPQTVFLWFWRFYPEYQVKQQQTALLFPSNDVIPDCSQHSYACTVAALTGVMYPQGWEEQQEHNNPQPYLLLFTFSPVQEFIKASRKFLDFWSGSYLLHYFSAYLCWQVAQQYGPDAIITPALWAQEIIDAFICKERPDWKRYFAEINPEGQDPITRFNQRTSTSLSTAGFPNVITILVSGQEAAQQLGQSLAEHLKQHWCKIAEKVRDQVRSQVSDSLTQKPLEQLWDQQFKTEFGDRSENPYYRELQQYQKHCCWEWRSLWEAQIEHTWEPYYVVVPLGHPASDRPLQIAKTESFCSDWINAQNQVVGAQQDSAGRYPIPAQAEETAYSHLNVGTWWGSYQARLGQLIQSVKNTRTWNLAVAPGERSSLSGLYSAVHPRFNYHKFQNGRGMEAGSLRLFWQVMAHAYPGLFNGSEKLNAIELTKRMAWVYGGVAEEIGIDITEIKKKIEVRQQRQQQTDKDIHINESIQMLYERIIRFPNFSSIAAARFMQQNKKLTEEYWDELSHLIKRRLPDNYRQFKRLTRLRPTQIHQVDQTFNPRQFARKNYNGVMFSSKWLADDMKLQGDQLSALRECVAQAHQTSGFGDGSPSDWWVLVLGDGDGMGKYVSGGKLEKYENYVRTELLDRTQLSDTVWNDLLQKTKKRMGPATHIGLNRALLDFSNRLVPYLTERRCCGRVIYSGGDDVMAALPLADLPRFLRSLRAAWSGAPDPENEFRSDGGYWHPLEPIPSGIPNRPLFTMGQGATMSLGIVIAHKSVPLPTVLEKLWEAEKERAKKLLGYSDAATKQVVFPEKDGLCFRVIYGSGNTLEALMKGHLLESWWQWVGEFEQLDNLSPLLYRLAEVLPQHADATPDTPPLELVAKVVIESRDEPLPDQIKQTLLDWLKQWSDWAWAAQETRKHQLQQTQSLSDQAAREQAKITLGTRSQDLSNLLRFTAFWVSRRQQELSWSQSTTATVPSGASR